MDKISELVTQEDIDLLNKESNDFQTKIIKKKLLDNAYNSFYTSKLRKLLQFRWEKSLFDKPKIETWNDLKNQLDEYRITQRTNAKYKNYFITITTTPETDKHHFISQIVKIFGNAVIDKGYLVFEQRGDSKETVGDGIHAHMLVKRDPKIYNHSKFQSRIFNQIIRLGINKTYKSYKNLVRLSKMKKSTFSCQNIKDETCKAKLDYISGDKDPEKLKKVEFDKLFRKKFELKKIYKKNLSPENKNLSPK